VKKFDQLDESPPQAFRNEDAGLDAGLSGEMYRITSFSQA